MTTEEMNQLLNPPLTCWTTCLIYLLIFYTNRNALNLRQRYES